MKGNPAGRRGRRKPLTGVGLGHSEQRLPMVVVRTRVELLAACCGASARASCMVQGPVGEVELARLHAGHERCPLVGGETVGRAPKRLGVHHRYGARMSAHPDAAAPGGDELERLRRRRRRGLSVGNGSDVNAPFGVAWQEHFREFFQLSAPQGPPCMSDPSALLLLRTAAGPSRSATDPQKGEVGLMGTWAWVLAVSAAAVAPLRHLIAMLRGMLRDYLVYRDRQASRRELRKYLDGISRRKYSTADVVKLLKATGLNRDPYLPQDDTGTASIAQAVALASLRRGGSDTPGQMRSAVGESVDPPSGGDARSG